MAHWQPRVASDVEFVHDRFHLRLHVAAPFKRGKPQATPRLCSDCSHMDRSIATAVPGIDKRFDRRRTPRFEPDSPCFTPHREEALAARGAVTPSSLYSLPSARVASGKNAQTRKAAMQLLFVIREEHPIDLFGCCYGDRWHFRKTNVAHVPDVEASFRPRFVTTFLMCIMEVRRSARSRMSSQPGNSPACSGKSERRLQKSRCRREELLQQEGYGETRKDLNWAGGLDGMIDGGHTAAELRADLDASYSPRILHARVSLELVKKLYDRDVTQRLKAIDEQYACCLTNNTSNNNCSSSPSEHWAANAHSGHTCEQDAAAGCCKANTTKHSVASPGRGAT